MRAPRCALLLLLLQSVSSLPVSHTQPGHEDVEVIKCIVEVLADVLSKPRALPVSQQCLETLRTDDRLVTVLRRRNFLQELQDIAGEGTNERSEKGSEECSDHAQVLQDPADQSMLMAVLTPGDTVKERGAEQEFQDSDIITSHEELNEEDEKGEEAVMKKTENGEEEEEAPEHKRVEQENQEEEQEEEQGEEQEEEQAESVEKRMAGVGKQKQWSRAREPGHRRAYGQQEAPHHSMEAWKSPEEEELQMMAGRGPEERRDPEEGSATKRTGDAEMESLAVMENELENMAQKLHELRHG